MLIEEIGVRLDQLRKELEVGEFELDKVERQRAQLRDTVLRISGAVQVLEELLAAVPIEHRPAAGGKER